MGREELIILCRADFSSKIRDNRIKEQCEICKGTENLVLHHTISFSDLFDLCCEELDIDIYREEFTDLEVINIREKMIAKQLDSEVKTVCNECHKLIHEKGFRYARSERKPKVEMVINEEEIEGLEEFLRESYEVNTIFTKESFREAIGNIINNDSRLLDIMNKLDGRNTREKGQKIYNKLFEKCNIKYLVGSKVRKEFVDGKRKNITYWTLVLEDEK